MVIWLYAIYSCALNSTKSKSLITWNIYSESGETFKILVSKQLQDCVLEKIIILAHILTLWIVRFLAPWQTFFMIVLWGSVKVFQEKADPVSLSISSSRTFLFSWGIHDKGKAAGWKVVSGHDSHYRIVFHSNLPPFPRFHSGSAPRGKGRESS